MVVWIFFLIAILWDWNENWPFPVLWPLLSFPNCWHTLSTALYFFNINLFNWRLITLQYCIGFAIHQHESATGIHVFPIPSHLHPHTIPLGHPSAPFQVQCMIQDARGWCTGMTQRDGMGREVEVGFSMGNTCTLVVDSCWCMAKPIQYCKVKKKN